MNKEKKNIYGYVRVSTREQNEDRQIMAIRELGVPERNIYLDKVSGKNFDVAFGLIFRTLHPTFSL